MKLRRRKLSASVQREVVCYCVQVRTVSEKRIVCNLSPLRQIHMLCFYFLSVCAVDAVILLLLGLLREELCHRFNNICRVFFHYNMTDSPGLDLMDR